MSDDDGIFKVQTVPPPPGETDAYSAPTKVGAMAASIVEEIVLHAQRQADSAALKVAALQPLPDESGGHVKALQVPRPAVAVRPAPVITTLPTPIPAPPSPVEEPANEHGEPQAAERGDASAALANGEGEPHALPTDADPVLATEAPEEITPTPEVTLTNGVEGDTPDVGVASPPTPAVRGSTGSRPYAVPLLLFALALVTFALYLVRR